MFREKSDSCGVVGFRRFGMKQNQYRVLLVEDDVSVASSLIFVLMHESAGRFEATHAGTLSRAKDLLQVDSFDVILLDLNLPDSNGLSTCISIHAFRPELPVVIMSGTEDEELAMASLKTGAQDYLIKGHVNGQFIARTLRYAIE